MNMEIPKMMIPKTVNWLISMTGDCFKKAVTQVYRKPVGLSVLMVTMAVIIKVMKKHP